MSAADCALWRNATLVQTPLREHFARLNRQWLEHSFQLEPADLASFADPHGTYLAGWAWETR